MSIPYAIDMSDVYKAYGSLHVLRGLHLQVKQGEVYGILGPNGAGKTTLIHLLLGFLKYTSGSIQMFGSSHLELVRGRIGYLSEQFRYHLRFTAREYLYYMGQFSDVSGPRLQARIEENLLAVGLHEVANRKLQTFTKGMLQRVGIAQALLVEPDLLLLDEPTSGLDPVFRYDVLDMLAKVRMHNTTMLVCTPHLDVIEHLCDRVGILSGGKLVTQAEVDHLRGIGSSVNIQVSYLDPVLQARLSALSSSVHCSDYIITLRPNSQHVQTEVLRLLLDEQVAVLSLESLERPIEHLYLETVRSSSLDEYPKQNQTNISVVSPDVDERFLRRNVSTDATPREGDE